MKRLVLALAIIALPAQAIEWPWQQAADTDYSYCKGFVYAGLGEFPVENLSRTQLWLSWNAINRVAMAGESISEESFQAGLERFDNLLTSSDLDSLLQIADRDCDLGP